MWDVISDISRGASTVGRVTSREALPNMQVRIGRGDESSRLSCTVSHMLGQGSCLQEVCWKVCLTMLGESGEPGLCIMSSAGVQGHRGTHKTRLLASESSGEAGVRNEV